MKKMRLLAILAALQPYRSICAFERQGDVFQRVLGGSVKKWLPLAGAMLFVALSVTGQSTKGVVIPNLKHLHSTIDADGTTHYGYVEVTLKPGSSAVVTCVGATSGNSVNVPPACVPITPSSPGGSVLPNVHAVPTSQRRTLTESKSGRITLGCKGQGASSCDADVMW